MSKVNALKAPRTENIMTLLGQWTRAELEELIVAKVNAAAVITRDDLIKVRKSTVAVIDGGSNMREGTGMFDLLPEDMFFNLLIQLPLELRLTLMTAVCKQFRATGKERIDMWSHVELSDSRVYNMESTHLVVSQSGAMRLFSYLQERNVKVKELDIISRNFDEATLKSLLASPILKNLETLKLRGQKFLSSVMTTLCKQPFVKALKVLSIQDGVSNSVATIKFLKLAANLERLELICHSIQMSDFAAICAAWRQIRGAPWRQTHGVPKLTAFYTDSNNNMLQSIGNLCPDINDLKPYTFDAKRFFQDQGTIAKMSSLRKLEICRLGWFFSNEGLTTEQNSHALRSLFNACPKLEHVSIHHHKQRLEVPWCALQGLPGVGNAMEHMPPGLRYLELGFMNIEPDAFAHTNLNYMEKIKLVKCGEHAPLVKNLIEKEYPATAVFIL